LGYGVGGIVVVVVVVLDVVVLVVVVLFYVILRVTLVDNVDGKVLPRPSSVYLHRIPKAAWGMVLVVLLLLFWMLLFWWRTYAAQRGVHPQLRNSR
jgi:hypothetical protein